MAVPTRFEQLEAWQEAHKLALAVYRSTQIFPGVERYGLTSQMRRAAVSIAGNIAEGFKRRGLADKVRFYPLAKTGDYRNTAEGSLEELKYYLILSKDLDYLPPEVFLTAQADTVGRLLNGLTASTERRKQCPTPYSLLPTPSAERG